MDQFISYAITIIKDIGFPVFVAVFVLLRIEPAIKHLDRVIMAMAVMIAKSNGMKEDEVAHIIEQVTAKEKRS